MITSASNQQLKNLSALMKKPKERKEQKSFVIEGTKMFLEAPPEWVQKVYVSESFQEENGHQSFIESYDFEVVSDSAFHAVSDTKTPQGILAVLRMPEYDWEELMAGRDTHLLVLESIQDPGNLGTMLRTGEGAGITGVVMNRTTADLFNPKTIRSTMGSIYRVPYYICDDLGEAIDKAKVSGVHFYAGHLKGSYMYDEPDYRQATGFLIGNEGSGLTDELAEHADAYVRIPMAGKVESLNAAVSASLLMYECSRQRRMDR